MAGKPTYEELEQKVKELENETLRRKELEEVLGKRKEQYHDLYENAPNAYFSVSAEDGSILRCNTAALKLLGYDRDTLMGMKVFDLYADNPHGISKAQDVFKRFKKGESIRGVEMQMKHKDGYPIWISLLVEPVRDHDGNIIESRSIVIDITEHKRTEDALQKKTHDLGERVKELNSLYGISMLVKQQDISLAEILQGIVDLIAPSWQYPEITCARVIIKGQEWKTKNFRETIWKQASDIKVHGELSGDLEIYYLEEKPEIDEGPFLREERNLIDAIAGLTGRIVERKQAEEALQESAEKYRTLLETTSEGCWLINPELKTVEVNATLCKMLGYSQDEMLGKTPFDFVDDENRKIFIEQTSKISTTLHRSYEITLKKNNGEDLQTYFNATTIRDESGGVLGSFAFITDITERKRAEEEIRLLKEKYEDLYSNAPIMYLSNDTNGIIIESNNTVLDKLGYTKREIIGKHMIKFMTKESADSFKKDFPKLLKTGKILGVERQLVAKDREIIDVILDVTVEYDEHGKPIKTRATFKDITERKLVENALRESEAQKRAILDASIDKIRYVDKDMKTIWANLTTAITHDISPEDLVGQVCHKVFVGRDTPCEGCPTVRALETGKIERAVMHQPRVKGMEGESYWDNYSVPIKNEAGHIEGFVLTSRDITNQKRAEEQIYSLTHELMKAQENERKMISRELHDRVAQDLTTAKIFSETLLRQHPEIAPEVRAKVSGISKTLQQTIGTVRNLSYDLRPPDLDHMGLVETIFQYCEDFSENTGVEVKFNSAGMDKLRLDFDTEINIYRLIQEGLNNINKHAKAGLATVKLAAAYPNIILRIEDNGKGFDIKKRMTEADSEKRMGLRSMEERVSLLQGKMTIQSRPMVGTKIFIRLPHPEKK